VQPAPGDTEGPESAPIQRWDCSGYPAPTCTAEEPVQSRLAPGEPPRPGPPEAARSESAPIQPKCDACAAETPKSSPQANRKRPVPTPSQPPTQPPSQTQASPSPKTIRREASRGLKDAALPLPHRERIQAAFGRHDISGVRAAVGGAAASASRRIGALAFASGDRIAFRGPPDLHLAAHEAAHVVQQREGLRLPGNVGQAGDPWERHADRVADAVLAGRSAEPLLDRVASRTETGRGTRAPGQTGRAGAQGDGTPSPEGPVQRQFVSPASRLFESEPSAPAAPPGAGAEAGGTGGGGAPGGGGAEPGAGAEGDPLAAAQGGDTESAPEGITVGGADGAPGAGPGAAGGGAPAAAPAAPPAAEGGGLNAPCYNVDPPPPPDNTPRPAADANSPEAQTQPQVTFDAWTDAPDKCEAEAQVQTGAQQATTPLQQAGGGGGSGAGPGGGAGAAPGAGPGAPQSAAAAGAEPAGGGGAGGGGGGGAGDAMSGPIAQGESGRDAAVADYLTSLGTLDSAESRSRSLAPGLSLFGPGSAGPQADAATARVRTFMDGASAQIAAAIAFARVQVPGRLGSRAESAKAAIRSAMEEQKSAISARVAAARGQAMASAAGARARILAEHGANLAAVELSTAAAQIALDAQYPAAQAQVDAKETKGLEDVNTRFAKGRKSHEDKGPEYANKALARGQAHVAEYDRCKVHPGSGVRNDDDGFWNGCLTVRRAKAQQDAACKTAAGYRTVFLRTANKKAYDLKDVRAQYRCAVIAGAQQVNETLDRTYEGLSKGLATGRAQAIAGLAAARDRSLAGVDAALAAALGALSRQEMTQRQAVNDAGYLNELVAEQLAHASAAGLAKGIGAALDSLQAHLSGLKERLAAGEVPDPRLLEDSLAGMERALGGGMGTLLGAMESGSADGESRIAAAGAAGLAALSAVTEGNAAQSAQAESGFAERMGTLAAGTGQAMGAIAGRQIEQAVQAATEGTASLRKAVAGFDEALATIGGRVDAALTQSLTGLDGELKTKLGELDAQIARDAWKAAEKEQPAWVGVVAVVLIILVVIIATAISIVTLGAGASLFAVILVGALVGAVSAGLIQVLNNWASGEALGQGVVQAMIMGAVGGALGGALGFAGGALAAGAAQVGARVVTQFAITLAADMVAEGLTQTFGYVVFGQQFNWQGFVMAGAMSGVSFRAHPSGPRPRAGGAPEVPGVPHPHAPEAPAVPRPHAPEGPSAPRAPGPEAPAAPSPTAPSPASRAAARRAAGQIGLGAGVALAVEGGMALATGQPLDARRLASAAASGAGARASHAGLGPRGAPPPERTGRLGRAHAAVETRLEGLGRRLAGGAPAAETPTTRPRAEEAPAPPKEEPTPPRGAPREGPETLPDRPPESAEAVPSRPAEAPEAPRPRGEAGEPTGPRRAQEEGPGPAERRPPASDLEGPEGPPRGRTRDGTHEADVGPRGPYRCSARCQLVRDAYPQALSERPDLAARLARLEAESRAGGGRGDRAIADETARLVQSLEDHAAAARMSDIALLDAIVAAPPGSPQADRLRYEAYRRNMANRSEPPLSYGDWITTRPPPGNPYAGLDRFGLTDVQRGALRANEIPASTAEGLLQRGMSPADLADLAARGGPPAVRAVDGLAAHPDIGLARARTLAAEAQSQGGLRALAETSPDTLARMLARGVSDAQVATVLGETGARGLRTVEGLLTQGLPLDQARSLARLAAEIGDLPELYASIGQRLDPRLADVPRLVESLAASGALENPAALAERLRTIRSEAMDVHGGSGVPVPKYGTLQQIEDAALRSGQPGARVSVEQWRDPTRPTTRPYQADIIQHAGPGGRIAVQHKEVSGGIDAVVRNSLEAVQQLRGLKGSGATPEVPPPGYRGIADIRVRPPEYGGNAATWNATRADLLAALRGNPDFVSHATTVRVHPFHPGEAPALMWSEIRITNANGTHVFTPADLSP
jgi:hypothetical protein